MMTSAVRQISINGTDKKNEDKNRRSSPLTHLFVELTSLEELSFPTSSSTRIKYTCLDASAHYLAVGSTSGTVYLFSRFASKHRNRIGSVPVQVISIKDGPVIKLSISPDEKYLAAASKQGSLTITAFAGLYQNPITLFSTDCHVGTEGSGQWSYITELCWRGDSTIIYAGDTRGRISRTRIHNRKFFRSPSDIIFETDSEIVQFDLRDDLLLASTLTRCCVCDLKTRSCIQVGKRLRNGHYGAVFYSDQEKRNLLHKNEHGRLANAIMTGPNELTVIFASRPNGRLWEANGCGVVYSTHQYRNLETVCRFPVVSFREDVLLNNTGDDDQNCNISFGRLTLVRCQDNLFIMTKTDKSFCLIDPKDSHLVLTSTVDHTDSVNEYAVSGTDIFLLSSRTGSLRKLTLFTLEKAVEKLHLRQCYCQAAQLIYVSHIMNKSHEISTMWDYDQLEDILNNVEASHLKSRLTVDMVETLQKLHSELKKAGGYERRAKAEIHRLNSGIHRVVQTMENSGYEDDFTFRAPSPLRLRSKSIPHMEQVHDWKRRSLPLNQRISIKATKIESEMSEEHHKKLINEVRLLLLDPKKSLNNQLVRSGSVESLRTLLDCSNVVVMFEQQVTINDITKDLEAAKKFLRLLGNYKSSGKGQKQRKFIIDEIDFKSLFGRRDPLEIVERCVESMPLSINVNVAHLRSVRRTKRGARIVKAIKPTGKRDMLPQAINIQSQQNEGISQHSIKCDHTSNANLHFNYNEIQRDEDYNRERSPNGENGSLENNIYIVENFVPVQPIKFTWKINDRDKENDLVSMKSSTATMTMNSGGDDDERLMQSSEITVAASTMTLSETKVAGNSSSFCRNCGLHSLWRHVMIFGPKMVQLRVTVDQFRDGGVPFSLSQWTSLFEYRSASLEDEESYTKQLCGDCASFFEFDERFVLKAAEIRETMERIEKGSREKTSYESSVRKAVKEWDNDFVYRTFFSDITSNDGGIRKNADVASCLEVPLKQQYSEKCPKKFLWLSSVTISQLLLCMRHCEGFSAVMEFLKGNQSLAQSLTAEDWKWFAIMKAYESTRICDVMPEEVVNSLLVEFQITTIEDVGTTSSPSFADYDCSGSSSPKLLSGSLIISVDGNCPCCTLPLKMKVTNSDGYLTVFRCGHLYHQICLREANLIHCLRCQIERKRLWQKQQQKQKQSNTISRISSSPYSTNQLLSSRSTRNTPVNTTRATTSPVSAKNSRDN